MEIRPIHHDECEELGRITVLAYRALNGGATLGTYEGELLDVTARQLDSEVYVAIDDDGNLLGGVTYVSGPKRKMSEFEDPEAAGI